MGLRIDLGCGSNKVAGCIGVDIDKNYHPDIVADITKPIPKPAGCAEFVMCRHVLEHLKPGQWRAVFSEIARLLEPGGTFEVRVPHPACENAMIEGHNFVLTPLYWQRVQDDTIAMRAPLVIDEVREIPHPECLKFCESHGINFGEWGRFLFNAFYETRVLGRRQ